MSRTPLLALTLLALVGLTAHADDKKAGQKDAPKVPDTAAMMAEWMKHATPSEGHKVLESLVGSWTYEGKMWMDPSAPPTTGKGTCERTWVLGGRFVQDKVNGTMDMPNMPPFEGLGLNGYDNSLNKYVSFWSDSYTTSGTISYGTFDAARKTITYEHDDFDPMIGQKIKVKDVVLLASKDKLVMTSFKLEGGKELKMMELTFTRKK